MDTAKHGHFFSTVTKFGINFLKHKAMQMGGRSRYNQKKILTKKKEIHIDNVQNKKKEKNQTSTPIRSPLSPSIWAAWVRE